MVVMSTEIGTLAEIESKTTERSVPRFTTSRSLSAGASAEMRIDIGQPAAKRPDSTAFTARNRICSSVW